MFRKFLAAVILAVFILSSQIAAAANVDWSKVPKFNTKDELADYIEYWRIEGYKKFYFTFPSVKIHNEQERKDFQWEICCIAPATSVFLEEDGGFGTGRFIYTIIKDYPETPGSRVSNAYLSRNQHQSWMNLTAEEQKLYNIAVGIVDEAKKRSSEVEKARYIHDEICRMVYNYKDENDRNKTAIGALIDHYAQCQGYSDAFYMLGRMAGFKVRRIGGKLNGNYHTWNTITLKNGKTYCVDVTIDDGRNSHEYFLATLEVMKRNYEHNWSAIPNLQ